MSAVLKAINQTIRVLCEELKMRSGKGADWLALSEEKLFYEIAVCIYGSQMLYEHALALADCSRAHGMFRMAAFSSGFDLYREKFSHLLARPIAINEEGKTRKIMPRFKNRLPKLLSDTAQNIYGKGYTVKSILRSAINASDAREILVTTVNGFGPKQASLYLRRIGYCSDLAVLDTHILDYLRMASEIEIEPTALSSLKKYETIESEFKRISEDFGYCVGCVDLAMWITMRVAKREYLIWAS